MVILGGELILLLFIGGHGCWLLIGVESGCFWEVYNVLAMLKSISLVALERFGCFSEGLLIRGFTV